MIKILYQCTLYSCLILMKLGISGQTFKKYSNVKFNENPLMGAELFLVDRRTDMTKVIIVFAMLRTRLQISTAP